MAIFVSSHSKVSGKGLADEEEMSSGNSDDDPVFEEDMEALRRACMLPGTNPLQPEKEEGTDRASMESSEEKDDDTDLEWARNIRKRFPDQNEEPLSLKPLRTLPPIAEEGEDDDEEFKILSDIEKRYASRSNPGQPSESSGDPCPDRHSGFIDWHQAESSSAFVPGPANLLMEAIRKNRAYQKTLRDKLIHIKAILEKHSKLMRDTNLLRNFQVYCKKRTGQALSLKKDPRVYLISFRKPKKSSGVKVIDENLPAIRLGPHENSQVPNYRMVLGKFPDSLHRHIYRDSWSKAELENLGKGVKQQFQASLFQQSMELFSGLEEPTIDSTSFNSIISPFREVNSEILRAFIPKVNWERLASMYLAGRFGAECEARWLNSEDPLINGNPWTPDEDKRLLYIIQQRGGFYNWIEIATMLGTNRTPFQCITRYQRSLNIHILKQEWTEDEDAQLRAAVEVFGENNWEDLASSMGGRTGPQCSHRWMKTLNPAREKVGRWALEEDKRLKVAVTLFRARAWNKIAHFVPGRTQAQCRERWVNVLDPTLNLEAWTKEEDSRLKAAIAEHGHCWFKVAASVHPRTDNQCRRRWKVLLPHEVPMLKQARRVKKAALVSNFVNRKEERPALGPSDFLTLPAPGGESPGKKKKRKRRNSKKQNDIASCDDTPKENRLKRSRVEPQNRQKMVRTGDVECFGVGDTVSVRKLRSKHKHPEFPSSSQPSEVSRITNDDDDDDDDETCTENASAKKKAHRSGSKKTKCLELAGNKGLPLSPEPLAILRIANDDYVANVDGDTNRKKKISKPHSKRTKRLKPTQAHQDPLSSVDFSNPPIDLLQVNHDLSNHNDIISNTIDLHDCSLKKKNTQKLPLRRDISTGRAQMDGDDMTLASYLKKKRCFKGQ